MANQVRNFFSRNFSTFNHLRASMSEPLKKSGMTTHDHEIRTLEMWKKLFIFGCIPAIVVAYLNATMGEEPKRQDFVNYPHLRIRTKPFPWGDGSKSLFHNPHVNALPTGYESEHH